MRWLITSFTATLCILQLDLWLSEDGRPGLKSMQQAVEQQTITNQGLADRNADLEAEVINLQQGFEAIEERARSELGMLLADETFYQIVDIDR